MLDRCIRTKEGSKLITWVCELFGGSCTIREVLGSLAAEGQRSVDVPMSSREQVAV